MALQKQKDLPNGTSGDYWRIIGLQVDCLSLTAAYIIALFKDQTHGVARTPHLGLFKKYIFSITENQMADDLLQFGYTSIKAKAASMVPPIGDPNGALVIYDADLAGASDI